MGVVIGGALLAAVLAAQAVPSVSVPNLILVANFEETRWCAFDSVTQASARADSDNALTVVNAWTAGGELLDLKVVWGPESTDWQVTDSYRLEGWSALSVERDVFYADRDERLSQTFTRRGERLVLTRSSQAGEYHPVELPHADLRKAPFHRLLVRALATPNLPDAGLCDRAGGG